MNSQLALDLKEQGIQCIEKVPQIADVRQAQQMFDEIEGMLARDHISANINSILDLEAPSDQRMPSSSTELGQEQILKHCENKEEAREKFKYGYSEQIVDVNKLCENSLTQVDGILTQIEDQEGNPQVLGMLDQLL